jgi:hypothetical protein
VAQVINESEAHVKDYEKFTLFDEVEE